MTPHKRVSDVAAEEWQAAIAEHGGSKKLAAESLGVSLCPGDYTDPELQAGIKAHDGCKQPAAVSLGLSLSSFESAARARGLKWDAHDKRDRRTRRKQRVLEALSEKLDYELLRWPGAWREKEAVAAEVFKAKKPRKVLVFSDLHCPYQVTPMVEEMLARDGDADFAACLGDAFDAYVLSHFRKETAVSWAREWGDAVTLFRSITDTVPTILLEANHERRLLKRLQDFQLDADVVEWLEDRGLHLVQELVAAMRGGRAWSVRSPWMMLGDVALAHFEDEHSVIPGRSATNIMDWFRKNITENLRGSVQAHTHKQGWVRHDNRHAIECGCLVHDQDYAIESGRAGPHKKEPWCRGYFVLYFDKDGRCDWKRCQMVPFDYKRLDYI